MTPTSSASPSRTLIYAPLALTAALLFWDFSGLDLPLAQFTGGPEGFPWQHHWFFTAVLHRGMKYLAWALALAVGISAIRPWGPFMALPTARRIQLALMPLLLAGVVAALKGTNNTSCPWDLAPFGGVATYASHWSSWLSGDGGGGHCFPAGHASSGFAFIRSYFALKQDVPRLARCWLLVAVVAGLLLGVTQQLRGAHFLSHTLWTGWICWLIGWASNPLFARYARSAGASG